MRQLILGGSFNPIHYGHLICSRAVAEKREFDQVLLVPASQPPHKPLSVNLAEAHDRLAITRLAVADDPFFAVDPIELERNGPSYTLDTVREMKARGQESIHWLIGADMLIYLPYWHRIDELLREVNFIIMARPGWSLDWATLPAAFQPLQENVVEAPLISITATDLRRRVAQGLSIRYLTPDAVCTYVREHGLYGNL